MNQNDFIATYGPLAEDVSNATGLHPSVVLGQIAQETGFGQHISGNNIFGISPGGKVASYPDVPSAAQAYVSLINSRYQNAATYSDPTQQALAIGAGGYGPNSSYGQAVADRAAKLRRVGFAADAGTTNAAPTTTAPATTSAPSQDDILTMIRGVTGQPNAQPGGQSQPDTSTAPSSDDLLQQMRSIGTSPGAPPSPGSIDPLTGQKVQYASAPSSNDPVANATGKPISENIPGYGGTQAAASFGSDPESRRRIVASELFPDMPLKDALARVYYGDDGRLAAVGASGNPFYVDPAPSHVSDVADTNPANPSNGVLDTHGSWNPLNWTSNIDLSNPLSRLGGYVADIPEVIGGTIGGVLGDNPLMMGMGTAAGNAVKSGITAYLDPTQVQQQGVGTALLKAGGNALLAGTEGAGLSLAGKAIGPLASDMIPGKAAVADPETLMAGKPTASLRDYDQNYLRAKAQKPVSPTPSELQANEPTYILPFKSKTDEPAPAGAAASAENDNSASSAPSESTVGAQAAPQAPPLTPEQRATYETRELNQTAAERASPNGVDATEYVPGVQPSQAEVLGQAEVAKTQKALSQLVTEPFVQREAANNAARTDFYNSIAGDGISLKNLEDARDTQATQDLNSAFANAAPGQANAQPVVDKINTLLSEGASKRSAVSGPLNDVLQNLYDSNGVLESDPRVLYAVRKDIGDKLSKQATAANPMNQHAASALADVKDSLDQVIEDAAPGFQQYLQNYTTNSLPIDEQEVLQSYNVPGGKGIFDVNGNMQLSRVQGMLKNIVTQRQAPGANPTKSVSDETMQKLFALRNDLARRNNIDLGRPRGSDTNSLMESTKSIKDHIADKLGWPVHALGAHFGLLGSLAANATMNQIKQRMKERQVKELEKMAEGYLSSHPAWEGPAY
jgi:hypothetical protein